MPSGLLLAVVFAADRFGRLAEFRHLVSRLFCALGKPK